MQETQDAADGQMQKTQPTKTIQQIQRDFSPVLSRMQQELLSYQQRQQHLQEVWKAMNVPPEILQQQEQQHQQQVGLLFGMWQQQQQQQQTTPSNRAQAHVSQREPKPQQEPQADEQPDEPEKKKRKKQFAEGGTETPVVGDTGIVVGGTETVSGIENVGGGTKMVPTIAGGTEDIIGRQTTFRVNDKPQVATKQEKTDYVGRRICKQFYNDDTRSSFQACYGTVIAHFLPEQNDAGVELWSVDYDDGDGEDMETGELLKCFALYQKIGKGGKYLEKEV